MSSQAYPSKACLTEAVKFNREKWTGLQFIFPLLAGLPDIAYLKLGERIYYFLSSWRTRANTEALLPFCVFAITSKSLFVLPEYIEFLFIREESLLINHSMSSQTARDIGHISKVLQKQRSVESRVVFLLFDFLLYLSQLTSLSLINTIFPELSWESIESNWRGKADTEK